MTDNRNPAAKRRCLVLYALGDGSARATDVANGRFTDIKEALDTFEVVGAGSLPFPGDIPSQALEAMINYDLIVADLTNNTPSVLYELAICHILAKPVIQVISAGNPSKLPVYARNQRTVTIIHNNAGDGKAELAKLAEAAVRLRPDQLTPIPTELRLLVARALSSEFSMAPNSSYTSDSTSATRAPIAEIPDVGEQAAERPTRDSLARANASLSQALDTLNRASDIRDAAERVDAESMRLNLRREASRLEEIAHVSIRSALQDEH